MTSFAPELDQPVTRIGAPPAQPGDLPFSLRFGWSVGTLGPVTLLYVVNYALLFFMTDLLGIGAAIAGLIIFGARIFDLALDLGVGALSDRTVTRWGRRRPWMLAGGLTSALGVVLVFNVPAGLIVAWAEAVATTA
jgi:GPH family glycoside/pentoside/hexuronide:cation symporter